jgi:hypothetical protein
MTAKDIKRWKRRVLVIAGSGASAVLMRFLIHYILNPYIWFPLQRDFARRVSSLFYDSVLEPAAPVVSNIVTIGMTDWVALFCIGLLLGRVFYRNCVATGCAFLATFAVVSSLTGDVSPWYIVHYGFLSRGGYAAVYPWTHAVTFAVFLLVIYASFVVGVWVGSRYGRKHLGYDGYCRKCGYDLRGLPEPRCPECGTPFKLDQIRQSLVSYGCY